MGCVVVLPSLATLRKWKIPERKAQRYMSLAKCDVTSDLDEQWQIISGRAPVEGDESTSPAPAEEDLTLDDLAARINFHHQEALRCLREELLRARDAMGDAAFSRTLRTLLMEYGISR